MGRPVHLAAGFFPNLSLTVGKKNVFTGMFSFQSPTFRLHIRLFSFSWSKVGEELPEFFSGFSHCGPVWHPVPTLIRKLNDF